MLKGLQNIHFIGIGGAGMSAIAHVLLKRALWFTWVMPNVRSTMSTP